MKLLDLSDRQRLVLSALRRFPQGATRAELSRVIQSITPSQIGSALNRLESMGLITLPYTAGERWHISPAV
jgi:DNA-binding transcriptional ArsR family regulator